jgi:eukaryotic-like serine/threonine-protein kinase
MACFPAIRNSLEKPATYNRRMLQPGSRVGAYRIISSIGSGGTGVIYRACDVRLGRDVALKVLPEKSRGSADAAGRYHVECVG